MTLTKVNPPGCGVEPEDFEANVYARGGNVCEGYCYPFCLNQSNQITLDSVTISTSPGAEGYVFGNIFGGAGAAAADTRAGRFCIAMHDILDRKIGRVKVKGYVRAKVHSTDNSAIGIGDQLFCGVQTVGALNVPVASALRKDVGSASNTPRKYVAIAQEVLTSTPSDGATMKVLFDGWDGVGGGANRT